jgi:hypothetical protein
MRTVPLRKCRKLAGILVKKLQSASLQAEDQQGQQQYSAAHSGQPDQRPHGEADQHF